MQALIVDDSSVTRDQIKEIIEGFGFSVCGEAGDGLEGLNKYKELKPDFVTLDVQMPVMDGVECLKKIIEYDLNAKVIVISTLDQQMAVIRSFQLGAISHIVKPFKKEDVYRELLKLK